MKLRWLVEEHNVPNGTTRRHLLAAMATARVTEIEREREAKRHLSLSLSFSAAVMHRQFRFPSPRQTCAHQRKLSPPPSLLGQGR